MEIAAFLYPGMTALDLIGPHEILSRLPGAVVTRVAQVAGPVQTDSGILLVADKSIDEVSSADMLLVPGSTNSWPVINDEAVLEWVRKLDATTQWTTSVCTGSLILAAAGVLKGQRATSHWYELQTLAEFGAEPVATRVVESGKYISGAGVSAGIDMALTLAARIAGEDFAQALQLGIEYDPQPPFDAGSPDKAPAEITALVTEMMQAVRTR